MGLQLDELSAINTSERDRIRELIERERVELIALSYPENAGISRVKLVPASRLDEILARGVGMSPVFDAFLSDDSVTASPYSGGPVGDLRLFPDLRGAAVLPTTSGHLWAPAVRYYQDGSPYALCHCGFALDQERRLASEGYQAAMSFEVEWTIASDQHADFQPATRGPAYSLARLAEVAEYVAAVTKALTHAGLNVLQIHPEYSPGQFEVSVGTTTPTLAADRLILTKLVVDLVSQEFGYRASFAPVVTLGGVGNGGHVHFSYLDNGAPLLAGFDLTSSVPSGPTASLVAHLLEGLPALCAIGSPTVLSYQRLQPQRWAGAFQAWGIENRECALRYVAPSPLVGTHGANLEIKSFDLASSPYLIVGAINAIAMHAFRNPLEPPSPLEVDPASLTPAEREMRGITPLPGSLPAALDALAGHQVLRDALGEPLYEAFRAVRLAEIERAEGMDLELLVEVERWKY
ncbi:MAG: glutamine synthetase [Acidimicrobiales bacterium]